MNIIKSLTHFMKFDGYIGMFRLSKSESRPFPIHDSYQQFCNKTTTLQGLGVPVPSQECKRLCIYALDVHVSTFVFCLFLRFYIGCRNCADCVVFFVFHFITPVVSFNNIGCPDLVKESFLFGPNFVCRSLSFFSLIYCYY